MVAAIIIIPILVLSIIFVSMHILFGTNESSDYKELVGCRGVALSKIDNTNGGVVSVNNSTKTAKTYSGVIERNEYVLIVKYENNVFMVERYS